MKGEPLPLKFSWIKNPALTNGYALCVDGSVIEFSGGPYGDQWITATLEDETITDVSSSGPEETSVWDPRKVYGTYEQLSQNILKFYYQDEVITLDATTTGGFPYIMTPEVTDIYQP